VEGEASVTHRPEYVDSQLWGWIHNPFCCIEQSHEHV